MIKREMEAELLKTAQWFPVISILGPRQSGKTTIAKKIFPKHIYVSLEDYDIRKQANEDPRMFLKNFRNEYGAIFDEIQHAPQLLSYIQTIVDEEKNNGYFILTGSQNILVNQAITQSLAGRNAILTLLPLSISELANENLLPDSIEEAAFKGGYPKIYAENVEPNILYNNYINSYVERDIRQLKNILDLSTFQHFLQLCAGRIGQTLNYSSLANDCGIDHKTAKSWLSLLEATYVVVLVYPYYKNLGKRLINMPKLYFVDTGIACSLLNIKSYQDLYGHFARGGIIESFIVSDFFKQFYNKSDNPSLYFWRDYQGNEIDCILETANKLFPIEIKAGRTVSGDYFKQFQYWKETVGDFPERNFVVYSGDMNMSRSIAQVLNWKKAGTLVEEILKLK